MINWFKSLFRKRNTIENNMKRGVYSDWFKYDEKTGVVTILKDGKYIVNSKKWNV